MHFKPYLLLGMSLCIAILFVLWSCDSVSTSASDGQTSSQDTINQNSVQVFGYKDKVWIKEAGGVCSDTDTNKGSTTKPIFLIVGDDVYVSNAGSQFASSCPSETDIQALTATQLQTSSTKWSLSNASSTGFSLLDTGGALVAKFGYDAGTNTLTSSDANNSQGYFSDQKYVINTSYTEFSVSSVIVDTIWMDSDTTFCTSTTEGSSAKKVMLFSNDGGNNKIYIDSIKNLRDTSQNCTQTIVEDYLTAENVKTKVTATGTTATSYTYTVSGDIITTTKTASDGTAFYFFYPVDYATADASKIGSIVLKGGKAGETLDGISLDERFTPVVEAAILEGTARVVKNTSWCAGSTQGNNGKHVLYFKNNILYFPDAWDILKDNTQTVCNEGTFKNLVTESNIISSSNGVYFKRVNYTITGNTITTDLYTTPAGQQKRFGFTFDSTNDTLTSTVQIQAGGGAEIQVGDVFASDLNTPVLQFYLWSIDDDYCNADDTAGNQEVTYMIFDNDNFFYYINGKDYIEYLVAQGKVTAGTCSEDNLLLGLLSKNNVISATKTKKIAYTTNSDGTVATVNDNVFSYVFDTTSNSNTIQLTTRGTQNPGDEIPAGVTEFIENKL